MTDPTPLPVTQDDPYCVCCCRPKSEHNSKMQCPETTYFVANEQSATSAEVERIWEAFEQAHALIQEAKGADGPDGGFVTDHLDFAENWLDKAEALTRAALASPPADHVAEPAAVAKGERYAAIGQTSNKGARWYIWRSGTRGNFVGGDIASQSSAKAIAAELNRLAALSTPEPPAYFLAGEAIPAGMKPWHGGDSAPEDWDGGQVMLTDGSFCMPVGHLWHPFGDVHVAAYTPKPTPPPIANARAEEREAAPISYADLVECEERVLAAEMKVVALTRALKPFVVKADKWEANRPGFGAPDSTQIQHRLGDFRAVRAAVIEHGIHSGEDA